MDGMTLHEVKKVVVTDWSKHKSYEIKKILITSRDGQEFEIALFR